MRPGILSLQKNNAAGHLLKTELDLQMD